MSTLAIRLPRKPGRRYTLLALAAAGTLVLGVASGRLAVSHYGKLLIEVAAAAAALGVAVWVMARRPRLGIVAILAALVFVPVYRVKTVQGLIFHPALLLCLLVAAALFLITYAGERSRLSAIDIAVVVLSASMLIAILLGPRTWKEAAAQLWVWIPPYVAGRLIAVRRPLGRTLAQATVVTGVLSTVFAVPEALGLGSPFFGAAQPTNPLVSAWDQPHLRVGESFRAQTAFGHPIAYSMFLAVAIIFAMVLHASTDNRRQRRLYLAAAVVLLAAQGLTVSRTGWVVLAVAFVILAVGRANQAASRVARRAVAAGAALLVAVALFVPSVAAVPLSIVGLQSDSNDPALQNSASYRTGLYSAAAQHNVFSWFGNKTSKLADQVELHNSSIDSEYLNLLDQWGALVTLPFLLVVGAVATRALTGRTDADDGWPNTFAATATGLAVGLGSVALITQQEYLVWLLFGLTAVPRSATPLDGVRDERGIWRFRPRDSALGKSAKTNAALLVAAIRRYWWIPISSALVFACAAVAIPRIVGPSYSATSALLFQAPQFDTMLLGPDFSKAHPRRDANTNLALLDLKVVAARTAAALGHGISTDRVARDVQVAEVQRSDVFTIQANDPDPRVAAAIANTYAQQYKLLAIQRQRADIDRRIAFQRLRLAALTPSDRLTDTERNLTETLRNLILLASLQNGGVELVAQARVPHTTSSTVNKRGIMYTMVLGLAVGLLLVGYVARRDRRVRDVGSLEDAFGTPVLGSIPKLDLAVLDTAHATGGTEAFRLLRGVLRYVNVDRKLGSLLVTSQSRGEGRTTVALNLAVAEAMAGTSRVLLVEADLRQPTLGWKLGLERGPGLTDVLSRTATLAEAISEVPLAGASGNGAGAPSMWVLPAGAIPSSPTAVLESQAMHHLLELLQARYDLVIIDAPALTVVPDAIPLLKIVDGVLVVARLASITREQASSLRERLHSVKAPVVGLVANAAEEPAGARLPLGKGWRTRPARASA